MYGGWAQWWAQYEELVRPVKLIVCEEKLLDRIGLVGKAVDMAQVEKRTHQWKLVFMEAVMIYFGEKGMSSLKR